MRKLVHRFGPAILMGLAIFALIWVLLSCLSCAAPKLRAENTSLKVELAYLKGFLAGFSAASGPADSAAHPRPSLMVQK